MMVYMSYRINLIEALTYNGLVMPYGDKYLDLYWLR